MDILTGFLEEDGSFNIANFQRRTYLITKMSGPSQSGTVTIEAKDPLKLADNDKVKFPTASKCTLNANINDIVTTIVVQDPDNQLTAWYASGQRHLKIDEEIVRASSHSYAAPLATLTVVRANMPAFYDFSKNLAAPHDAGATVQFCHLFENTRIDDLVYYLLDDVVGLDPAFLPLSEWQANIDNGFQGWLFSTLLTEPVGVKDLLTEITEHGILIWWDEREQKVQVKGLRFTALLNPTINDDTAIVGDSIDVDEDPKSLATQFWCYLDLSWPLADTKLLKSYRVINVAADLEQESPEAYGRQAIREIRSRWLYRASVGVAAEIGTIQIRQNSEIRKILTWEMDPKDDDYWVGDVVGISTKYVQAFDGTPDARNYLITQAEEVFTPAGFKLRYVAVEQFNLNRVGLITPNSMPDYLLASDAQRARYAFIGPNTGNFPDNTQPYQIG